MTGATKVLKRIIVLGLVACSSGDERMSKGDIDGEINKVVRR